jgi:hypothetical protein
MNVRNGRIIYYQLRRLPENEYVIGHCCLSAAETRSEAEDKSIGGLQSAAVQSAVSVPMSVTPPDLALIHAAIHGYRTGQHQHQQQHQMPTAGAAAFQMTEQRRSPGTAAATLMPSLFSPPSSSPATSPPRRLLYAAAAAAAAAGIHFRRPVQRRLDVETAAADENDGECYFYDDDDEDIDGMQTAAAAADDDDANVEASCFVSRQRRGVRSPDSCIDHGFADYYSQTEGDLSLFA